MKPEVVGGADKSFAEDALPNAVNEDAGHERLLGGDKPAGETETVFRGVLGKEAEGGRHAGLKNFADGLVVLPAVK